MALVALAQAVATAVLGPRRRILDGELSAGGVDHQLRDGEGGDLVGALLQQPRVLLFDLAQAADAGAEDHAAAERIFAGELDAGVAHGVDAGRPWRTA